MSILVRPQPTREEYDEIFERERKSEYGAIDRFEKTCGWTINRSLLEEIARKLACPFKANPPNWQHGRVIYSLWASVAHESQGPFSALDIGTAKGFSAVCARWALDDAGHSDSSVVSVDVIDPSARVLRNTVVEVDGPKTLYEILEKVHGATKIFFVGMTSIGLLSDWKNRINFAFVDGKHNVNTVTTEVLLLSGLQQRGDVLLIDDLQVPGVARAVWDVAARDYDVTELVVIPGKRSYAVGRRR